MNKCGFGLIGILISVAIIVVMSVIALKATRSDGVPVNTAEERQGIIDEARDIADGLEERDRNLFK